MCGICGVLHDRDSHERVDADVLGRMRDAMAHRGPDGEGMWIDEDRRVGLGFRRLSIVDLSDLANQPMTNEDGSVWVVFNGEIYNHAELRDELIAHGHRFRTDHSDTEAIVHGYEQWGVDVLDRLDGMFGLAVWDVSRERMLLARDRVGIKPLYFCRPPGALLFASEIKALVEHPRVSSSLNVAAMHHYLSFMTTPAPMTMFEGIYKLPAGSFMTVEGDGEPRFQRYWDPRPRGDAAASDTAREPSADAEIASIRKVRQLLGDSIEKRMMSDVPFGVFLSGGLDSTANVALMSELMSRPVSTFTVGFEDHTYLNELEHARFAARTFKTDHHEVMVDEKRMMEYLPEMVHSQDEPIADWVCIPLYFVSKLARDNGTIVVQVGEGSDEQFSGYGGYMRHLRLYRRYWQPYRRLPQSLQNAGVSVAKLIAAVAGRGEAYADVIERAAGDREHFWGGANILGETAKRRLLSPQAFERNRVAPFAEVEGLLPDGFVEPDSYKVIEHYMAECDRPPAKPDVLARMIYLEFKLRLPELLLMRVDKISMSTSIEARVPFLDHRLVEHSLGIPEGLKIKGNEPKYLLKRACEGLVPDSVIQRKKRGFGAPMADWLRGEFGRVAQDTIMSSRLRNEGLFNDDEITKMFQAHRNGANFAAPIWVTYNLTAWFDHWIG